MVALAKNNKVEKNKIQLENEELSSHKLRFIYKNMLLLHFFLNKKLSEENQKHDFDERQVVDELACKQQRNWMFPLSYFSS